MLYWVEEGLVFMIRKACLFGPRERLEGRQTQQGGRSGTVNPWDQDKASQRLTRRQTGLLAPRNCHVMTSPGSPQQDGALFSLTSSLHGPESPPNHPL